MLTVRLDPDRTSVVAMYGPKPPILKQLVRNLQAALRGMLEGSFTPRPLDNVHSTIVGLDVCVGGTADRDVRGILTFLLEEFRCAPFTVQYGGYDLSDRRVLSRGKSLYERSLTVQGDKVVLIGWPILPRTDTDYSISQRLAMIRRGCEKFGVQHKYHSNPDVDDPDSYLVIGTVASSTSIDLQLLLKATASSLARPTRVLLDDSCLSVIQYVDFALPRATSEVWTIQEALAGM